MSDTVNVPVIGTAQKKYVLMAVAALVGMVGYAYWRNAQAGPVEEDTAAEELPSDLTAAEGFGDGPSGTAAGGWWGGDQEEAPLFRRPVSNAEWSRMAADELEGSGWDRKTVLEALGEYLDRRPLTGDEQAVVRAALAAVGTPPEGGPYTIVGVGAAQLGAPTGVRAVRVTETSVDLEWTKVEGADGYRVYRSGASQNVGHSIDTKARVGGLQADTEYSFTVRAMVSGTEKTGPSSAPLKVRTKKRALSAPKGLKASAGRTSVSLTWGTISGVPGYRIYRKGVGEPIGASKDGRFTVRGLKPRTRYYFQVAAIDNRGSVGKRTGWLSVTTKK